MKLCIAKLFCGEAANKHAARCRANLRRLWLLDEYPVERYFRDAKVLNIYEGTREIQRLIIGQDALGIRYANGSKTGMPTALAGVGI